MLALGIITLVLSCFVMILYGYLARNTDHDVSFFLSVGIIAIIMNLCSNGSESARVLAWLYLGIDVVFLALSFAVSAQSTLGFYKSIGPWFKRVFSSSTIGMELVSFIIAPAGIVLYFSNYSSNTEKAGVYGKLGLWGLLIWLLILFTILAIV